MEQEIIQVADEFVGRPYMVNDRGEPEWDCYKLLVAWYGKFGFKIPDYRYEIKWYKNGKNYFVEEYNKLWRALDRTESLKIHDAILFRFASVVPNHVGIYIGEGKLIECMDGRGTVISPLSKYRKTIYGFFR